MSEYIERGALMQRMGKFISSVDTVEQALMLNHILKVIIEFPAADVAPVIRCRDCKFYKKESWSVCGHMDAMVEPHADGFCSYGERKGGE